VRESRRQRRQRRQKNRKNQKKMWGRGQGTVGGREKMLVWCCGINESRWSK
jgi:predicted metal-binding transcription factor (methanogenesis marker protein 9)